MPNDDAPQTAEQTRPGMEQAFAGKMTPQVRCQFAGIAVALARSVPQALLSDQAHVAGARPDAREERRRVYVTDQPRRPGHVLHHEERHVTKVALVGAGREVCAMPGCWSLARNVASFSTRRSASSAVTPGRTTLTATVRTGRICVAR